MADLAREEFIKYITRCSQSGFFKGAERFTAGKEAAEGKVDLPDDDPSLIELLIQFFYQGEYDPQLPNEVGGYIPLIVQSSETCPNQNYTVCPHHTCDSRTCGDDCRIFICEECTGVSGVTSPDDLLLHAKMYELADKYDINGLKLLSREKLSQSCVRYWDDDLFPNALEHALSSTPEEDQGLRYVLYSTIVAHATLLENKHIEEIIGHHGVFAYQLIKKQAAEVHQLKK